MIIDRDMEDPNTPTDQELVRRFLADRRASSFEILYERHTPYLFRVARRMLGGNESAAEDALQEAWIRAVSSLPRFRGESALRTWLCGITLNCCRETWRRKAMLPIEAVSDTASSAGGGDLNAVHLERALARLDEPSREIVELFDILGHTHEEIAGILGIAIGTSKSRLFRARETLRTFLGTDEKSASAKKE